MKAAFRTSVLLPFALAMLAAPALAQDGQQALSSPHPTGRCGQPFALTHLLGVPVDVQPAAPFAATISRLEPVYLEFSLTSTARTVLRTEASEAGEDPVLSLFDSTGAALATSDDDAGGYDGLIDMTLAPATYCAQVRLYGGDPGQSPTVTLRLATGAAAEDLAYVEPDPGAGPPACQDPAMTADLGRGFGAGFGTQGLSGRLEPGAVQDWRVTVLDGTPLGVTASSGEFDTVLEVYDSTGYLLTSNDDGPDGSTNSVLSQSLAPGDYCLRLVSFAGEGSGAYDVTVTDQPVETGANDLYAQLCADPSLTQNVGILSPGLGVAELRALVAPGARQDFTFVLADEMPLQIDASSTEFDTIATLVRDGEYVDQNDDSPVGATTDSRITGLMAPGAYCLSVQGFDGAGGNIRVALTDQVEDTSFLPPPAACSDPARLTAMGGFGPGIGTDLRNGTLAQRSVGDFSFTVTAPVTLQLDARSSDFDSLLTLFDVNGNVLDENDDGPVGVDSRLVVDLQPGAYCARVASFDERGGAYEFSVSDSIDAGSPAMPANYCADPAILSELPFTVSASMSPGEARWTVADGSRADFGFSVAEPGSFRFEARSAQLDTVLKLSDAAGNVIFENDDSAAGGTDSLIEAALEPGRYCATVESFSGTGGDVVMAVAAAGGGVPGVVTPPELPPVTPGLPVFCADPATTAVLGDALASGALNLDGTLAPGAVQDYLLTLPQGGDLQVDVRSGAFDTYLRVVDGLGTGVAENDDGPAGTDSQVIATLGGGDYCLRVEGFGGGGGPFTLSAALSGAPSAQSGGPGMASTGTLPAEGETVEELGVLGDLLQTSAQEPALTKWTAFTVDAGATVRVDGVSPSGTFELRLVSEGGEILASAVSPGGFVPASLSAQVPPGRYLVAMQLAPEATTRLRNLTIRRE